MILSLRRLIATPKRTEGILVFGESQLMTMEAPLHHLRLTGAGAIRSGQYQVARKDNGQLRVHDEVVGRYLVLSSGRNISNEAEIVVGNTIKDGEMRGSQRALDVLAGEINEAMDRRDEVLLEIFDPGL